MDDRSWMYQDFPEGLHIMDYCSGIQGFIIYTLSNLRKTSEDDIRCPCKRYKNKKFLNPYVVMIYFFIKKRFMERYMCWFAYEESHAPYETMIENMIGSTSSSSNVHGVVNDNNNLL